MIIPDLIACVLLTGKVKEISESYFEWKPWLDRIPVEQGGRPGGPPGA